MWTACADRRGPPPELDSYREPASASGSRLELEAGAARLALHETDRPAVVLGDGVDDGEPEPRAVLAGGVPHLEDGLAVVLRDPWAVVGDVEAVAVVEVADLDGDVPGAVRLDAVAARHRLGGGVLHRVPEEVLEEL